MVENVVSVKSELGFDSFGEVEILGHRQVGEEGPWAAEGIATHVPELAACRQGERARGALTNVERLAGKQVRTAVAGVVRQIRNTAAFAQGGCERQASAPVGGVRNLPATNQEVCRAAHIAEVFLA